MKRVLLLYIISLSLQAFGQTVPQPAPAVIPAADTVSSLKKLLPDTVKVAEVEKPAPWHPVPLVSITSTPAIDKLMDMYTASAMESKTVQGYVIQIFYGRLQTARDMKDAFLKLYPDETVEIEYDTPDYKVFVGSYMDIGTAKVALGVLKSKGEEYQGAFIRPKEIKIYNETK